MEGAIKAIGAPLASYFARNPAVVRNALVIAENLFLGRSYSKDEILEVG
jgi:hypothetical protein